LSYDSKKITGDKNGNNNNWELAGQEEDLLYERTIARGSYEGGVLGTHGSSLGGLAKAETGCSLGVASVEGTMGSRRKRESRSCSSK